MRVVIKKSGWRRFRLGPLALAFLTIGLVILLSGAAVFTFYYVRFSRLIDQRLKGPIFPNVAQIYAAPRIVKPGDEGKAADVASYLRLAGYGEGRTTPRGSFELLPNAIRIYPGVDSYFAEEPAELSFSDGKLSSLISLKDQFARSEYSLEPLLITNLFDRRREKRRVVSFNDLPPNLVNAVVAIEDRRFFEHSGVDYLRILKAAYVDLRSGGVRQGASTLTMQLARGLLFTRERTWKRKVAETLVAFQLEHRLTKKQIFEYYCNSIYLGQRGSFSISGFGEGSQSYFNKDIRNLTLPEAAFLAGIVRGPNLYSPYRDLGLAVKRRNQVLEAMAETGAITAKQKADAEATLLQVAPSYGVASEAPYFVDMVKDQLLEKYSEDELATESYRVYTTLDLDLQRAAAEAMRIGIAEVDQRLAALHPHKKAAGQNGPKSEAPSEEAALIAIDAHTGAIKALVGGRDYGRSQLNRILAHRQPGSVFKPFVYATALSSGIRYDNAGPALTPVSTVEDEPTTFMFNGKEYEPANFKQEYYGTVTLRTALMHSLNVATVKVAETVGYDAVVSLARRAGMNLQIQPTPAVALGAYEVTPLEVAGAYTIFANQGVRMDPYAVDIVRDRNGTALERAKPKGISVLDPRVAFLMTSLMEDVVNHGTGEDVRKRGLQIPVAGKTGTSHDGWFAGYTSNLICIVWVGYDSDEELPLTGALSALPIWTEFMKRAIAVPQYSGVTDFIPPPGVIQVEIDPDTGQLATPGCPKREMEYFIDGTQPQTYCGLPNVPALQRPVPGIPIANIAPPMAPPPGSPATTAVVPLPQAPPGAAPAAEEQQKPKKKGFFGRIFGIFTGGDSDQKQ